jgi:hypothetical protein
VPHMRMTVRPAVRPISKSVAGFDFAFAYFVCICDFLVSLSGRFAFGSLVCDLTLVCLCAAHPVRCGHVTAVPARYCSLNAILYRSHGRSLLECGEFEYCTESRVASGIL